MANTSILGNNSQIRSGLTDQDEMFDMLSQGRSQKIVGRIVVSPSS